MRFRACSLPGLARYRAPAEPPYQRLTMFNRHDLADAAGAILLQKAERRFEGLVAQHGVSNPSELPTALQERILHSAIVETAAATFPTANIEMLKHGFRSCAHSAFRRA